MSDTNEISHDHANPDTLELICDPQCLAPMASILNAEQLCEIVTTCVGDAQEKTNLIFHAADTKNWDEVAGYAHDIKSSAGQMGAVRMQKLAAKLEANCKNEGGSRGADLVAELKTVAGETFATFSESQIPGIVARVEV